MKSVYVAQYICKHVAPIGLAGYNDVILGLPHGNGNTDITIKGTLSRFVEGKVYLVNISSMEGW